MAILSGKTPARDPLQVDEKKLPLRTNIFWIGANLLFDTQTGATNQVLMFVQSEAEATVFSEQDAQAYLNFVSVRADRFSPGIRWTMPPARNATGRWVIRGEQDVF